jgi:hypothetical protein
MIQEESGRIHYSEQMGPIYAPIETKNKFKEKEVPSYFNEW